VIIAMHFQSRRPAYILHDSERDNASEKPMRGALHVQGWILGLLAAIALLGFLAGTFVYITLFLRINARVKWHWAALSAAGAMSVLSALGYVLVLRYPEGLLQMFFELPWPFD
jgi:hypothetical protein